MWKSKATGLIFSHGESYYSQHERFVLIRYFNVEMLVAPFSGTSYALFTFARASQNESNVVFANFYFPPNRRAPDS